VSRRRPNLYSHDEDKSEFLKIFRDLCRTRQPWEVWTDLMSVMACSISNSVDQTEKRFNSREKEYADCIKRLGGNEKAAQLFAIIVMALEKNPDQDYLGALYMQLELGNHWKGQYFTPYHASQVMAELTLVNSKELIENDGWISICDPCIGGGAMMIAAANTFRRQEINYQDQVLFAGQDIDRVASMMAYIQLSLLGCPGYIVVGNCLTNPIVGQALFPVEQEGQELWYTPFYFSEVWHYRRQFKMMDLLFRADGQSAVPESEPINLRTGFLFEFFPEEETHVKEDQEEWI